MRSRSMELAEAYHPGSYVSADEIKEEHEDEYANTAMVFGENWSTSPPELKETERKIPPIIWSVSPVAASWVILIIIMALRIHYTSVTSDKMKYSEDANKKYLNLIAEYQQLQEDFQLLTVEDQQFRPQIQQLNSEIQQLKKENHNLDAKIQLLQTENYTLSYEIQQLKTENYNLNAEIQQLKTKNYTLSYEIQQLKTENYTLSYEIQQLKTENYTLSSVYQNTSDSPQYTYSYFGRKRRQIEPCLQGWLHFQSSCYMISSQNNPDQKAWQEARDDCRQDDADLVIIENPEEQDFIYKSTLAGFGTSGYWIGLRAEAGGWKWVSGSSPTHSYWVQPPAENLNCAVSARESSGWKSVSCEDKNWWICQKEALSS